MQITENVWQVGGGELTSAEDAAIYLVRLGVAAALIDAGCGDATSKLLANIRRVLPPEVPVTHLLLTHCHFDHTGGAAQVRGHLGCTVVAHQLDAAFLEAVDNEVTAASWYGRSMPPLTVDHKIKGATEAIAVGGGEIVAHHCPGHSPGSVVYVAEIDGRKILFGQDIHGPLHPGLRSNRADYLRSLQFILTLEADILCEGHFGVMRGKDKVRQFVRSYLE
jgi:glyoxylase-like metal-dependent hydrolase (beta-lactamase superfamily II)